MKKILVPTDFSPNADKALNFAVQLAKKAKAVIVIVHACDLLELTFRDHLALKQEYNRAVVKERKAKLALIKKSIEETEGIKVQVKLYEGLITDTILYAAKAHRADIIIMGTLGSASGNDKIFGSRTAGIIGKANIPVLSVPLLSEWRPPARIILAINNLKEANLVLTRPLLQLAALFSSHLHIAIFTKGHMPGTKKYAEDEMILEAYLTKVQAGKKKIPVTTVHLGGTTFIPTIEDYISANEIDMVAMITHRRSFTQGIFHKSLTRRMSYQSDIPLLALPALAG
jgi:nucleotide-binding universal stress UspA family protein